MSPTRILSIKPINLNGLGGGVGGSGIRVSIRVCVMLIVLLADLHVDSDMSWYFHEPLQDLIQIMLRRELLFDTMLRNRLY